MIKNTDMTVERNYKRKKSEEHLLHEAKELHLRKICYPDLEVQKSPDSLQLKPARRGGKKKQDHSGASAGRSLERMVPSREPFDVQKRKWDDTCSPIEPSGPTEVSTRNPSPEVEVAIKVTAEAAWGGCIDHPTPSASRWPPLLVPDKGGGRRPNKVNWTSQSTVVMVTKKDSEPASATISSLILISFDWSPWKTAKKKKRFKDHGGKENWMPKWLRRGPTI
jgi:hypothetical protein